MKLLLAFIPLFFLAAAADAATIQGRVLNAQGAPVSGAKVIAATQDPGSRRETVTGADGSYAIEELKPGSYTLTVSATSSPESLRREVSLKEPAVSLKLDFQFGQARAQAPSAGPERNPNIFIYRIDLNDLRSRLMSTRGPDPQYIAEFLPEQNYYGVEFGAPLFPFEPLRPRSLAKDWRGSVFGVHQNSALNARNFFNVGPLLASRASSYDLSGGGPLISQRASLLMQFGQSFTSGAVNGNIQAPTASERTPRSADPRLNAIVASLLKAYPLDLPNLPAVTARQLNSNAPRDVASTDGLGRFDLKLTPRASLAVRYSINNYSEDPFQLVAGQNPHTDLRNQTADLSLSSSLSARMAALFGFRFDRAKALLQPTREFSELFAPLGIRDVPDILFSNNPTTYSALANIGPGPKFPRFRVQNRFQTYADVTRTLGRHNWKFGWSSARGQLNDLQSDNARGAFSFNADFGRSPAENFLRGTPSAFTVTLGNLYRGFRSWEHSFYMQDQIRLFPTLSLSAGVRYELMTAPVEVNRLHDVGFISDKNNFSPRLGLAWNPGGGRTVIRASYGISYGAIFPATYQISRFNPPAIQVLQVSAPDMVRELTAGVRQPVQGGRSGLNLLSPDLVTPYSHQYNLAIERPLPWTSTLRLAYIGSRSFHLLTQGIYNRARPVPGIPTTTATVNQRRLDPTHFAINVVESNSIAYYDAAQVWWDKRLTRGATFRAVYTFSKNIDTGGDFTNTAAGVEVPGEIGTPGSELTDRFNDQKGPSLFDSPHNMSLIYTYAVPFPSRFALASVLLRGWQISGASNFQSGVPFHLHTGSDGPGFGNVDGSGQDRPNILNPAILGKSVDHPDTAPLIMRREYFDTNLPPGGRGSLGQNTFRKSGTHNWNVALTRLFRIPGNRENAIQFRTEFFNLFNRPQFDRPAAFVADEAFGNITNTINKGRQIQFSLRMSF